MKKVAQLKDFADNTTLRVQYNNQWVLLCLQGKDVYAISDKCPHMGASLYKGSFENGVVTCASHKAQIDVKTGEILEKAKILFLKMPTKKATTFKVTIKEGDIFLE